MDGMQVALLTLAAVLVGMMVPVMAQLWLTLRGVREELHQMHAKLDPTLDDMRAVLAQVRSATQVATAVGAAVTAGVRAWRDTTAQRAESPCNRPDLGPSHSEDSDPRRRPRAAPTVRHLPCSTH